MPSDARSAPPASYPVFDWLRIVLAGAVALQHDEVIPWGNAGNLAVLTFFALSGWLIGGIVLETRPEGVPRFYFNRATRIWIPYAFAIALLMAASLLKEPVTARWLEFWFYDVTFTHNLFGVPQLLLHKSEMPLDGTGNHFWSICAEEQFYLLAPLLLVFTRWGRHPLFWVAASLLALATDAYTAITLGVLAAILKTRWGAWHQKPAARVGFVVVMAASVAVFALAPEGYRYAAPAFAISLVLLSAVEGKRSAVGEFLGGISYPLYLNHWIGVFAAHAIFGRFDLRDAPIAKLAAFAGNLAVASILYVLIDQQIQRRRSKFFTPRLGRALAITGYALVAVGVVGGLALMAARA